MATNKNHPTDHSMSNNKDKDEYKIKAYTYTLFVSGNNCATKPNTASTTNQHNM